MENRDRVILHCDLNNFFASVACLDNPDLVGKPVAVCGRKEERHGIVLAKNQLAKEKGVITAETIGSAQYKCPDLIIVPPNYKRYLEVSRAVREIYSRYTDMVESFGIDECWLDVTGSQRLFGDGVTIANEIRETVKREIGVTISVGVSFNKIFAKLGSDIKKPDAVTEIPFDKFKETVWNLPATALLMVGKSTEKALSQIGVSTIKDLATIDVKTLRLKLGKNGETLHRFANGLDTSPVTNIDYSPIPKSIGRSNTTPSDLCSLEEIRPVLLEQCEDIAFKLRKYGLEAHSVQIHMRQKDLLTFEYQAPLKFPTQLTTELLSAGMELIRKRFSSYNPLRSVGIRAINLTPKDSEFQISVFDDLTKREGLKQIEESLDKIRSRFGEGTVVRASLLNKPDNSVTPKKPVDYGF